MSKGFFNYQSSIANLRRLNHEFPDFLLVFLNSKVAYFRIANDVFSGAKCITFIHVSNVLNNIHICKYLTNYF